MSLACILELQQPEDLLECCRCPQIVPDATETIIRRRACHTLSYHDFYWKHMHANWPLVLTDVSNTWECKQRWTQSDNIQPSATNTTNTAINFDYLRHKLGNRQVPVANCSREYFNSHAKCEMGFHDYLDYWQQKSRHEINQKQNTVGTIANANIDDIPTAKSENLYLKDWHLKAQMPDYDFYTVPKHFASDWLNEYLIDNGKDDYRFVYMGPKDSWTPFHADVFGSYSWSTNIIGCKRWLLLPPGEENILKDKLGNVPFRISEQLLREQHVRYFIIDQTENESIFVPSGWFHQVHNITDTISVNHNWFNACNLQKIWHNLELNMQQVVAEIEDCRQMDNFEEHCHTMLRASFGLNFEDFLNMLEHIAAKRLRCHNNNNNPDTKSTADKSSNLIFHKYILNEYHARYDLHCINQVTENMLQNAAITNSRDVLYRRCISLQKLTKTF